MTTRQGQLWLVLYAALGPPMAFVLYLFIRDHIEGVVLPQVELAILIMLLISGSVCAYLGLPGNRLFRASVTFVYLLLSTAVTFFVAFAFECSRGNCL
jgi:hypothetical protein